MGRSLFLRLLRAIRLLLSRSKNIVTEPVIKLLRALSTLWNLARSGLRLGHRRPPSQDTKNIYDSHDDEKPNLNESSNDITTSPTKPEATTQHAPHIIPLDSSISCSLYPPYMHDPYSRSSVSLDRQAARSAHSLAVAAYRNESRSSHNLSSHHSSRVNTPEPSIASPAHTPERTSIIETTESNLRIQPPLNDPQDDVEYTFNVKSPDQPNSPSSPWQSPSRRRSSAVGDNEDVLNHRVSHPIEEIFERQSSRRTTSPEVGSAGAMEPLCHDDIWPVTPSWFARYETYKRVVKEETNIIIPPFTRTFHREPFPEGWVPVLHPEGVLYFHNPSKHAVTDADLYNPRYYQKVMETIGVLEAFITRNKLTMPKHYTLAIDPVYEEGEGSIIPRYYFADHDNRTIFFLDNYQTKDLRHTRSIYGMTSMVHIGHALESEYWDHWALYPTTAVNLQGAINSLKDTILHFIGDILTSAPFHTAPNTVEELHQMLSILNGMKKLPSDQIAGAASLVGRFSWRFSNARLVHWAGTPQRRLMRNQSVYGDQKKRTWLIKFLSPLLFFAPETHLYLLEQTWVDQMMHQFVWAESMKDLIQEWIEFILYATVLLNANVAWLAIQSIDVNEGNHRTAVQIASYLAMIASIGSIIIGLLLVRQARKRERNSAQDASTFLARINHPTLGLEMLAILYSLPYALLLWGMVAFLTSFACNCFDGSSTPTRIIMGIAWAFLAILAVWCIFVGWDTEPLEADTLPIEDHEKVDEIGSEKGESGGGSVHNHEHGHLPDETRSHTSSRRQHASRPQSPYITAPSTQPQYPPRPASRASHAPTHPADTGSIRSVRFRTPVASVRSGIGGARNAAERGKKKWWPSIISFWNSRRTSVDSEKTMTNV